MNQKPMTREQLLEKLLELQNKIAELESTQLGLEDEIKALEEVRNHFSELFNHSHDGIAIIQDELVKFANPKISQMLHYPAEKLVGIRYTEFIDPEVLPAAADRYKRRKAGEAISPITESVLKSAAGGSVLVEVYVGPIAFQQQPALLLIIHDITYARWAEEQLLTLRPYQESLAESANIWVDVLDRNANVVFWNRAAEEISGYCMDEVIGHQGIWELLYPDEQYRASILLKTEAIIQQGDEAISLETTIQRKDGSPRVISWNSRDVLDNGRNPIGSIALGQDITKRKTAEKELNRSYEKVKTLLDSTLRSMGAMVEARDPYTAGHNRRVAQLSVAIARELGLSDEQIEGIHKAGLGHDIGKIGVPAEILMKPTRLSDAEYLILRTHPRASYDILKEIEFSQPVATIALQHHERINGSGYPLGISGQEILLEARIMAVADVVEAMSSHRPYRPALGIEKALAEINTQRGILYDTQVVNACSNLFTQGRFKFEEINA